MRITDELSSIYIDLNGDIDWSKILEKNSTGKSPNYLYGETTREFVILIPPSKWCSQFENYFAVELPSNPTSCGRETPLTDLDSRL